MNRTLALGQLTGLHLSAVPSAQVGAIVLWVAFTLLSQAVRGGSVLEAVVVGFASMLLWWLSELLHQLGHAYAARQTGYPMVGIRFWGVLSTSLYPDEPPLPARIHLRRAFGGPITSIAIGVVALVVFVLLGVPVQSLVGWLLVLFAAVKALFFGVGSFVPLGFTDGSTILEWWGKD